MKIICDSCGEEIDSSIDLCPFCGAKAKMESTPEEEAVGELTKLILKKYEYIGTGGNNKIGGGGFAQIFKGRNLSNGDMVAIKRFIPTREISDEDVIEAERRFRYEADIMKKCTHTNIPFTYDVLEVNNKVGAKTFTASGYITDFIDGKNLEEIYLNEGCPRMTVSDAKELSLQMFNTLKYLEQRHILHLDINPRNIMFGTTHTEKPRYYLIDYGFSVYQPDASTSWDWGTSGYIAMDRPPNVSYKSDIYSMGQTIYSLLCGILPQVRTPSEMEEYEKTKLNKKLDENKRKLSYRKAKFEIINQKEREKAFLTAKEKAGEEYCGLFDIIERTIEPVEVEKRPSAEEVYDCLRGRRTIVCWKCKNNIDADLVVCPTCGSIQSSVSSEPWESMFGGYTNNMARAYVTTKRYDNAVAKIAAYPTPTIPLIRDDFLYTLTADKTISKIDIGEVGKQYLINIYNAPKYKLPCNVSRSGAIYKDTVLLPMEDGTIIVLDDKMQLIKTIVFEKHVTEISAGLTVYGDFCFAVCGNYVYRIDLNSGYSMQQIHIAEPIVTPVTVAGEDVVFASQSAVYMHPIRSFYKVTIVDTHINIQVGLFGASIINPIVYSGGGLFLLLKEPNSVSRKIKCMDISGNTKFIINIKKTLNAPVVMGKNLYIPSEEGLLLYDIDKQNFATDRIIERAAYRKIVCFANKVIGSEYIYQDNKIVNNNAENYCVCGIYKDFVVAVSPSGGVFFLGQ